MSHISNPKASVSRAVVLKKDLYAYGNYGKDSECDILYSGERGNWTFNLTHLLESQLPTGIADLKAYLAVSLVLDDHRSDVAKYKGAIKVNKSDLFLGSFSSLGVVHGEPFGKIFSNWRHLLFPIAIMNEDEISVEIVNSSDLSSKDFIAIDTIKLLLIINP